MKARDFWILEYSDSNADVFQKEPENKTAMVHVREVKPLDWREIWKKFTASLPEELCLEIQELVEKAIRGE